LVSGDIFLLGGGHILQSQHTSTDTSSNSSAFDMVSLKKSHTKRSKKQTKVMKSSGCILEEEEKVEDDSDSPLPQSNEKCTEQQKLDRARKLAERDAYLKRPPNQTVTLIKSVFPHTEPFLFFPYPPYLKVQRPLPKDYNRIVQFNQRDIPASQLMNFKFHHSTHTYNGVVNALKMAGFHHVEKKSGEWNVLWTGLFKAGRLKNLNGFQKINHFAGSWGIGSKAHMWRHVQRMRRIHGPSFEIAPQTYIFPEDYKRFTLDREQEKKQMYIMKPAASSCGRGIRIIGKNTTVKKRAGYVVSKYIKNPHLIRGYKYDLRVYVVVTSFEPLKIYIFKEGLVRLATVPYTTCKSSLKQRFVHLTNYSVNKKAETYQKNNRNGEPEQPA
jgi:tubulin polyglutamylase TTLL4